MQERPGPEIQPVKTQTRAERLRKRATMLYSTATLFLVLGFTALIGGSIEHKVNKDKAGRDDVAIATGVSLLVGGAIVSRFASGQDTLAEMTENRQKAMDKINSN